MSGRRRVRARAEYRTLGPIRCVCLTCGATISTNALAKAGHESGAAHVEAHDSMTEKKRARMAAHVENMAAKDAQRTFHRLAWRWWTA